MNKLKKNKKLIIIILSIILVIISLLGTSYALIYKEKILESQNSYTTGNLQLSLTPGTNLNLTNVFPMTDEEGETTTPYTFTVENTGTVIYKYNLKLVTTTTENLINPDYIKIKIDDNTPVTLSSINEVLYQNLYLEAGKSQTFNIRIWLDENTPNSEIGKSYSAKITMDGESVDKVQGFVELVMAKQAESDVDIDFTQTSQATGTNGIYLKSGTENDTHPIYYYRGAVDNNLIFAGFCWKIVRSTETGGIKILYNGLPSGGHCDNTGTASQIGTSEFNVIEEEKDLSPALTGYMYGTVYESTFDDTIADNTTTIYYGNDVSYSNGVYTLEDTISSNDWSSIYAGGLDNYHYTCFTNGRTCSNVHYIYYTSDSLVIYNTLSGGKKIENALSDMFDSNTNSSTIKGNKDTSGSIDYWYYNNIETTTYKNYLEDTVWCYDRSIYSLGPYNPDGGRAYPSYDSEQAMIESILMFNEYAVAGLGLEPTLTCDRSQDRFTTNTSNGNGKLDYPVGLITTSETILAGATGYDSNDSYYLYTGQNYWGGSPFGFVSDGDFGDPVVSGVYSDGSAGGDVVDNGLGVRPSVSLKPGTMFNGGSGKVDDPYILN